LGPRPLTVQAEPVALMIQRLLALTPARETPALEQARAEDFVSMGLMLHGLGLTPTREAVTLTLADDAGQQFRFEAHALPLNIGDTLPWTDVFKSAPLYLQHPDQPFWYQYLPEASLVYGSFRGYDNLSSRAADL